MDGAVFYAPGSVVGVSDQPMFIPQPGVAGCPVGLPMDVVYLVDNTPGIALCDTACVRGAILSRLLRYQLPWFDSPIRDGTAGIVTFGGAPSTAVPLLDISNFHDTLGVNSMILMAAADSLVSGCGQADSAGARGFDDALSLAGQWLDEYGQTDRRFIVVLSGRESLDDTTLVSLLAQCESLLAAGSSPPWMSFGLLCADTTDSLLGSIARCTNGSALVVDSVEDFMGSQAAMEIRMHGDAFWTGEMYPCILRNLTPGLPDSVDLDLVLMLVDGVVHIPDTDIPLPLYPGANLLEFYAVANNICTRESDTLGCRVTVVVDTGHEYMDLYGDFTPACTTEVEIRSRRALKPGSRSVRIRQRGPLLRIDAPASGYVVLVGLQGRAVYRARVKEGPTVVPLPVSLAPGVYRVVSEGLAGPGSSNQNSMMLVR
jgi:hypothetical protein